MNIEKMSKEELMAELKERIDFLPEEAKEDFINFVLVYMALG